MIEWRPHPGPQERVLSLSNSIFEILYGGARGGGKTEAGIVWLTDYIDHPRYRALVIRKNADDLTDWVDRAQRMYANLGVKVAYRPAVFRFPSGAIINTGHLKDEQAYTKYLGQEKHRMLVEELTLIATEKRYLQLLGSCRSTIPELKPQIFNTTNPGAVGHAWVKKRFVDVAPPNTKYTDPTTGRLRIYIPSRIDDNPTLMKNDPGYVRFLEGLKETDYELWRAWRLGDWNTFAGQFFKEFRRDLHVTPPFTPRPSMRKIGSIDWGLLAPFVFLSTVIQTINMQDGRDFIRAWTHRTIDGKEKTPEVWAKIIMETVNLDEYLWIKGDPKMFHRQDDGSISIADQIKKVWGKHGHKLQPANNDRIGGWTMVHKWLSIAPDKLPYWLITENNNNLIRTLPDLIHDESKVEDLITNYGADFSEAVNTILRDDWADAARYMLMHLKWVDAKVGGTAGKEVLKKYKEVLPTTREGDLISLDTDEFKKTEKKGKSWKGQ